jgi:two-component system phosphate regulon sensor histidine kinase PhoR
MFSSIRWRIAIIFAVVILIAIAGLSFYLAQVFKDNYISQLEAQLTDQSLLVADSSAADIAGYDSESLNEMAKRLGAQIEARITIIDVDGVVLGDSEEDPAVMENHSDRPEVISALSTGKGSSTRYSNTLKMDMMYVAVPIIVDGSTLGVARLSLPLEDINQIISQMYRSVAFGALIAVVITVLLAFQISRTTLEPIKKLTQLSRRLARGELDQEIEVVSNDEIGELAYEFNYMSARIKEMVALLAGERDRMSLILDQMGDGIVIVDGKSRITMVNKAASRMLEIDELKALGTAFIEAIRDYEIDGIIKDCLETGKQQKKIIELKDRNLYLGIISTPLEGKAGCLMLIQDLAEIRRLEKIRQDFFSNLSHELRTPIASMKALSDTLKEGAIKDAEVADDFLNKISVELDKLNQLTNEMSELSQIESGRLRLDKSPINIEDTVNNAIERLEAQAERAGLKMACDFSRPLPSPMADSLRIEQALVNLIHNAIKFTPSGGRIEIAAREVDGEVVISIADTGTGIPSEDIPRIFERFYKVDRARSSGSGTGLGLAIAKHIVQAHGGRIWVESKQGQGTTFYFTLPV